MTFETGVTTGYKIGELGNGSKWVFFHVGQNDSGNMT